MKKTCEREEGNTYRWNSNGKENLLMKKACGGKREIYIGLRTRLRGNPKDSLNHQVSQAFDVIRMTSRMVSILVI